MNKTIILVLIALGLFSCTKPQAKVGDCLYHKENESHYKIVGINQKTYTFKHCSRLEESKQKCFLESSPDTAHFDVFDDNTNFINIDCSSIK